MASSASSHMSFNIIEYGTPQIKMDLPRLKNPRTSAENPYGTEPHKPFFDYQELMARKVAEVGVDTDVELADTDNTDIERQRNRAKRASLESDSDADSDYSGIKVDGEQLLRKAAKCVTEHNRKRGILDATDSESEAKRRRQVDDEMENFKFLNEHVFNKLDNITKKAQAESSQEEPSVPVRRSRPQTPHHKRKPKVQSRRDDSQDASDEDDECNNRELSRNSFNRSVNSGRGSGGKGSRASEANSRSSSRVSSRASSRANSRSSSRASSRGGNRSDDEAEEEDDEVNNEGNGENANTEVNANESNVDGSNVDGSNVNDVDYESNTIVENVGVEGDFNKENLAPSGKESNIETVALGSAKSNIDVYNFDEDDNASVKSGTSASQSRKSKTKSTIAVGKNLDDRLKSLQLNLELTDANKGNSTKGGSLLNANGSAKNSVKNGSAKGGSVKGGSVNSKVNNSNSKSASKSKANNSSSEKTIKPKVAKPTPTPVPTKTLASNSQSNNQTSNNQTSSQSNNQNSQSSQSNESTSNDSSSNNSSSNSQSTVVNVNAQSNDNTQSNNNTQSNVQSNVQVNDQIDTQANDQINTQSNTQSNTQPNTQSSTAPTKRPTLINHANTKVSDRMHELKLKMNPPRRTDEATILAIERAALTCKQCNKTYKTARNLSKHTCKPKKSAAPKRGKKRTSSESSACSEPENKSEAPEKKRKLPSTPLGVPVPLTSNSADKQALYDEFKVVEPGFKHMHKLNAIDTHKHPIELHETYACKVSELAYAQYHNETNCTAAEFKRETANVRQSLSKQIASIQNQLKDKSMDKELSGKLKLRIKFLRAYKQMKLAEYSYTCPKLKMFSKKMERIFTGNRVDSKGSLPNKITNADVQNAISSIGKMQVDDGDLTCIARSLENYITLITLSVLATMVNKRSCRVTRANIASVLALQYAMNHDKESYPMPEHGTIKTPSDGKLNVIICRNVLDLNNITSVDQVMDVLMDEFNGELKNLWVKFLFYFKPSSDYFKVIKEFYIKYIMASYMALCKMEEKRASGKPSNFRQCMAIVINNCTWFPFKDYANHTDVNLDRQADDLFEQCDVKRSTSSAGTKRKANRATKEVPSKRQRCDSSDNESVASRSPSPVKSAPVQSSLANKAMANKVMASAPMASTPLANKPTTPAVTKPKRDDMIEGGYFPMSRVVKIRRLEQRRMEANAANRGNLNSNTNSNLNSNPNSNSNPTPTNNTDSNTNSAKSTNNTDTTNNTTNNTNPTNNANSTNTTNPTNNNSSNPSNSAPKKRTSNGSRKSSASSKIDPSRIKSRELIENDDFSSDEN
ncbi:stress-induced protein STI1 [Heliothis zea nudivirus]|uniref:Stress-induced protein STI1 n=1 Tax=Heliothis zea nudivirus 1 TaxID=3116536 RepID=Q8JKP9_9VIRU|nr:stress-induced protein STI1 [Heliothis zea nudivirus]AAN04356.1 stress-induced protein STI1 [Heliothis zea nudivirus]